MATQAGKTHPSGSEIVQAVVPRELAEELRQAARMERRSMSAVLRNALEDALGRNPQPDPLIEQSQRLSSY